MLRNRQSLRAQFAVAQRHKLPTRASDAFALPGFWRCTKEGPVVIVTACLHDRRRKDLPELT